MKTFTPPPQRMPFEPQRAGCVDRINPGLLPTRFIAAAMDFAMVTSTKGTVNSSTDLTPQPPALRYLKWFASEDFVRKLGKAWQRAWRGPGHEFGAVPTMPARSY